MRSQDKNEEAIFEAVVNLTNRTERDAYLSQACGNDNRLRSAIEELLRHHDVDSFLDVSPVDSDITREIYSVSESAGTTIDKYKLLGKIGEGGMAVVYMAEQEQPIRRKVALKIIKLGMDTRSVIARFEAERQTLAMMEHPNIAKVLDAGATETGRPYFVMELVKGAPVTDFCDANKLSMSERLELFVCICRAVQHAHQKGIIHRDIKPSNIMVTMQDGRPLPKVIDFGIAKAINHRLTETTLITNHSPFIGTPVYMSPEQADMSESDIDTRSDIYSLGILLYELLTGTTPFNDENLSEAGYVEMQRVICEQEPHKPSTKLGTLGETLTQTAAYRRCSPDSLRKQIRGDLDLVVMKSLNKDRALRYTTASEFASDIERHLRGEPVTAGPPTAFYRMKRFMRRRLALTAAAASVVTAVLAGLVFSTIMYMQTRRALGREIAARAELQTVSHFLTDDLLASVYPERTGGDDVTVRYILNTASENLDVKFLNSPLSEAAIRQTLGQTYRKMGDYPAAELHLRRALEIRREQLGPEDTSTLTSLDNLGWLYWCQGRNEKALPLLAEAFETRRRTLGPEHADTLQSMVHLSWLDMDGSGSTEQVTLPEKAYEIARRALGKEHPVALDAAAVLAMKYVARLKHAEAEAMAPEAYEISRRILGQEHETTLVLMNALVWLYGRQKNIDKGVTLGEKAFESAQRVFGQGHLLTLHAMANLGFIYTLQGRYDEADTILTHSLELARANMGPAHSITICCGLKLGILYRAQGRFDEHDALLTELMDLSLGKYGPDSFLTGYVRYGLKVRKGQLEELIEQRYASGDNEGTAAAIARLEQINKALEGHPIKPTGQSRR